MSKHNIETIISILNKHLHGVSLIMMYMLVLDSLIFNKTPHASI